MVNVIGVRFRHAGKIYYFNPGAAEIKRGDHVIVETSRGVEFGDVVLGNHEVEESKVIQPLKEVIRMANEEDVQRIRENNEKQKEAFAACQEKIRKHGLDMKLIDCEYTFDNSKILFYFTADGRIDFRELVKDLAAMFRTRIELRQVGVRDETKILGGIGICGRALCCHSYLSDFVPVSIKMAKEQNLSLNPVKISGVCGRLMCCLKNEEEVYEELNRKLPNPGDYVTTEEGLSGEVQSVSILKQLVKVIVNLPNDEKEIREYPADALSFRPRRGKGKGSRASEKELKELEKLEALEEGQTPEELKTGKKEPRARKDRRDGEKKPHQNRGEKEPRGEKRERREKGEKEKKRDFGDKERQREKSEKNGQKEPKAGSERRENKENGGQPKGDRPKHKNRRFYGKDRRKQVNADE